LSSTSTDVGIRAGQAHSAQQFRPTGNADQQCDAHSLRPSERILAQVYFLIYRGSEMAATFELGPRLVLFVTVCAAVSQFHPDMAGTVLSSRAVRINSP
jgi:hypothetical protein